MPYQVHRCQGAYEQGPGTRLQLLQQRYIQYPGDPSKHDLQLCPAEDMFGVLPSHLFNNQCPS
eukprot:1103808-Pelagomonas_calceolata.AAC.4